MPKLDPTPLTARDLEQYLSESDDFQLELHVFRSCLAAGMQASHGGSYKDPVTGLNRQFDVRAADVEGCSLLRMAIECKATRPFHPLLVSRIPREVHESAHYAIVSYKNFSSPRCATEKLATYFHDGEQVGKSTSQVGRLAARRDEFVSSDGEIFGKWSQAIASANDLVSLAAEDFSSVGKSPVSATTVLPILVISDGTLWVADHGSEGAMLDKPSQVDECSIYLDVNVPISEIRHVVYPITHLLVFTKSGFDMFLQKVSRNGGFRSSLCVRSADVRSIAEKNFGTISAI